MIVRTATRAALALALGVASLGAAAPATEWPRFRGDAANTGVATGPLPETLAKRWAYATGGAVRSSAVLGHGRAYIGSGDGALHAIDLADGTRAWTFATGAAVDAPPLIDGDTIFVGSTDGVFYAIRRDGELVWKADTGGKITGAPAIARDASSGRTLVLIGSHAGTVSAFDVEAADGTLAWSHEVVEPVNGGIAIEGGRAAFSACDDRLHVLDAMSGAPLGSFDLGGIAPGTVALAGDDAFVGTLDGELLAVAGDSGAVRWRHGDGSFEIHSSPAVTAAAVIFGSRDRSVHALERADGTPRWSFETRARVDGSPVVSGDRVVVGSFDGRVYLLELASGALVDSYEVGGRISGSPAVAPGLVVIGTESGEVLALGAKG